ncbi:PQQ-binding-like beta-propeller repeat protein, partial [Planctomycetota bacterium]
RRLIWECATVQRTIANPIVHAGLVYVADYGGEVHCLEAATGRTVWVHDVGARVWGTFLLAGEHLYVGDEDGRITVLREGRTAEVVTTTELDEPIWTVPAVAHGILYLSTERHLYAIGH